MISSNNNYSLTPRITLTLNRLLTKPTATTNNKTPTLHHNNHNSYNLTLPINKNHFTTTAHTSTTTIKNTLRKNPTSHETASSAPVPAASSVTYYWALE